MKNPNVFGVYNSVAKKWQFESLDSHSQEEVGKKLTDLIGWDSAKWRFKIKKKNMYIQKSPNYKGKFKNYFD